MLQWIRKPHCTIEVVIGDEIDTIENYVEIDQNMESKFYSIVHDLVHHIPWIDFKCIHQKQTKFSYVMRFHAYAGTIIDVIFKQKGKLNKNTAVKIDDRIFDTVNRASVELGSKLD